VYSLKPFEWYENALGAETAEREELPIVEAISGGVPAEFAALWRADVERWEQRQQQRQQPTTTRDNTHGRENSQTRENSEARVLPAG
jgi:molybdopterin-biosynthesis enzyme MoeA-like protein